MCVWLQEQGDSGYQSLDSAQSRCGTLLPLLPGKGAEQPFRGLLASQLQCTKCNHKVRSPRRLVGFGVRIANTCVTKTLLSSLWNVLRCERKMRSNDLCFWNVVFLGFFCSVQWSTIRLTVSRSIFRQYPWWVLIQIHPVHLKCCVKLACCSVAECRFAVEYRTRRSGA